MTRSMLAILSQAVERAGIHMDAVAWRRDAAFRGVGLVGGDDDAHRQPERPREVEVALVVRGHRHDRAGAVVGQHIVGGPHRDPLAVDRVDRVPA